MYLDKPAVFINPVLRFEDDELMEVLDDCMSFPELLVKVKRHKRCTIEFNDLDWNNNQINLEGDLSELLQHEYDHLNGILATMRAIDNKSFCLKSQREIFQKLVLIIALRDIKIIDELPKQVTPEILKLRIST